MSNAYPLGWSVAKLTEVADVWFSGVDKKSNPSERQVRLCNYLDVFRNREIRPNLDFMKATATQGEITRNRLLKGDVVFTKDSETADEIAECAFVAETADDLVCGYHLAIARPHASRLLGSFLAHSLRLPRTRHQFVRSANGVVRHGLTLDAIEEVILAIPTIAEQRRIVAVLDTWDRAIDTADSLIAAKLKRLSVAAKRLAWSDQDDWRPLSDYMEPSRDRVGVGRSLEVFSVTRDGLKPQLEQFNKRIANEDIARHMLLKPGEFALSGLNFWLGSIAVSDLKNDVCISPDYKVFRFKEGASPDYFRHLVRTDSFRELLISCSTERASVVRRNFNRGLFLESEIPAPPLVEQEKRARVLDAIAAELQAVKTLHSLLLIQKRGLMQKLLTGECRLDESFDLPARELQAAVLGGVA
jgi:type I restriction enzyme S subunit